jgi:hypothetical protein
MMKPTIQQDDASEGSSDVSSSASDEGSIASETESEASSKPAKRARTASLAKARPERKPSSVRKPAIGRTPSKTPLPGARQFILEKLPGILKTLLVLDEEALKAYAAELESALWLAFKEVKDGKEVAGARYKSVVF